MKLLYALTSCILPFFLATAASPPADPFDDFEDASIWKPIASDGVALSIHPDAGPDGRCIRLDIDFTTGAGYGIARRDVDIHLPVTPDGNTGNYEFSFDVRANLPVNNLEFKLVDDGAAADGDAPAAGESVWWINRRAFVFPGEWTTLSNRRRHIQFAWGPSGGRPLRRVSAIEFAISSATGGKGSVWIDNLRFRALPEPRPLSTPARVVASSSERGFEAEHALTGGPAWWRPAATDTRPTLTIHLGGSSEIGGIMFDLDGAPAPGALRIHGATAEAGGEFGPESIGYLSASGTALLPFSERDADRVRLRFAASGPLPALGVRSLRLLPAGVSASSTSVLQHLAATAPAGHWPRALLNKQSYWTVVGEPDAPGELLINEEGQVELWARGPSLEPFLYIDGVLRTWADARHSTSLAEGALPLPEVVRTGDGCRLSITACTIAGRADQEPGHVVRYRVTNTGLQPLRGALLLALRPIQVNPPWQFLNTVGGAAKIESIAVGPSTGSSADSLLIDAAHTLTFVPSPRQLGTTNLHTGDVIDYFARGIAPGAGEQRGALLPSAGARFDFSLAPGDTAETHVVLTPARAEPLPLDPAALNALAHAARDAWRERLSRVAITVPPPAQWIVDSMRSNLAYILINADGPAIQPGSRSYARSWIRDGCLTSSALLSLGHADEAVRFIDWYGEHLFDSGKVPCVVDHRGPDPVPENDSHGEYIFGVMNAYRFTRDRAILDRHWERVQRVVQYIEALRRERLTPSFSDTGPGRQEPGKPPVPAAAFRGLMPESISHEGYSAKPMHSYWDDLFTLRGLKDAAAMAVIMGDAATQARYRRLLDEFSADFAASVRRTMQAHGIDYVPGCVELGDFDSTSTTIALWPCDAAGVLPDSALHATFDRYWRFVQDRARTGAEWDAFTPYELRHVGAYIRLGQPDRALGVLEYMKQHQRPAGWNHWAEVVFRDRDSPRFIGDMPHTWCGSDFINSARSLFLYEDERREALVVFAGVPAEWAGTPPGVSFAHMPTWYGNLSASIREHAGVTTATLSGDAAAPGGIVVRPPRRGARGARVNGHEAPVGPSGEVTVRQLPATVEWRE